MYNNTFVYFEHSKHHCSLGWLVIRTRPQSFSPSSMHASLALVVKFTVHALIGPGNPIVSFSLHLVHLKFSVVSFHLLEKKLI